MLSKTQPRGVNLITQYTELALQIMAKRHPEMDVPNKEKTDEHYQEPIQMDDDFNIHLMDARNLLH